MCCMEVKRTNHAVYDVKYHLLWARKDGKWILRGDSRERVEEICEEISQSHDFETDTVEIAEEHVHLVLSLLPRDTISKVVGMCKSISASVTGKEHPEVKQGLWGGEFWEDGYFVRTVADTVTADVISNYITYHREQEKSPEQLKLF